MAESDAAGPAPSDRPPSPQKAPRRTTLAQVAREMERRSAPLRQAAAEAEKFRRQIESFTETGRRLRAEFGIEEDEAEGGGLPASEPAPAPEPCPVQPATPARPAFEIDPPTHLLAALRQAFPGFKPTDRWWFHVEGQLKEISHRGNPAGHAAFCAAYARWSAEDLLRHLEAEGLAERMKGGRPHKRTVEGLDVNQWVAAMAAADPTFRHLSQKAAAKLGPFSARAIGMCEVWIQMKAMLKAEADEAAERAKAELADRRGEDEDPNGLRQSSTKHGIGRQPVSRKESEHNRAVEAFLRSKANDPGKRRAK